MRLRLEKDRPGWIRGTHPGKRPTVAEVAFDATDPDGAVEATITAPTRGDETWRPTALMERASVFLEERSEPASQRQVLDTKRGGVNGKRDYVIQALAALVSDGYVTTAGGARGATLYSSVKPYREGTA